jgi:hypothetical protein
MAEQRRSSRGGGGKSIPTHPLVEALAPDPAQPPEKAVRLYGYPGPSTDANATRLYLDHELSSYVEVPNDAIRHSQTLENDAGTIVWVDPKASIRHSTTQSQEVQADFLSGGIAQQHLATAAAAGPAAGAVLQPTPTVQVSIFGPVCWGTFTQIPHCWRTEACPPSHFLPCASIGALHCTLLPPCPSVAPLCQVATQLCHSIGIACTVVPPCPVQTGFVCPSQLRCPSGPVCGGPVIDPISPIAR